MKMKRLFFVALLAGALSVLGCGSDDGGGSNGGGNTNGGGNGASGVCAECDSQQLVPQCEQVYNVCIQDDAGTPEDCAIAALIACGVV